MAHEDPSHLRCEPLTPALSRKGRGSFGVELVGFADDGVDGLLDLVVGVVFAGALLAWGHRVGERRALGVFALAAAGSMVERIHGDTNAVQRRVVLAARERALLKLFQAVSGYGEEGLDGDAVEAVLAGRAVLETEHDAR